MSSLFKSHPRSRTTFTLLRRERRGKCRHYSSLILLQWRPSHTYGGEEGVRTERQMSSLFVMGRPFTVEDLGPHSDTALPFFLIINNKGEYCLESCRGASIHGQLCMDDISKLLYYRPYNPLLYFCEIIKQFCEAPAKLQQGKSANTSWTGFAWNILFKTWFPEDYSVTYRWQLFRSWTMFVRLPIVLQWYEYSSIR